MASFRYSEAEPRRVKKKAVAPFLEEHVARLCVARAALLIESNASP